MPNRAARSRFGRSAFKRLPTNHGPICFLALCGDEAAVPHSIDVIGCLITPPLASGVQNPSLPVDVQPASDEIHSSSRVWW